MEEWQQEVQSLTEVGLFTERQAEAYILRDVELIPRQGAAETMGVSVNVLDKHLSAARRKVRQAEETLAVVESARHEDLATECDECGKEIGGRWVTDSDRDEKLCLGCADVEVGLI